MLPRNYHHLTWTRILANFHRDTDNDILGTVLTTEFQLLERLDDGGVTRKPTHNVLYRCCQQDVRLQADMLSLVSMLGSRARSDGPAIWTQCGGNFVSKEI
jgi:hypothetical protein